jgi:hypothetical protein
LNNTQSTLHKESQSGTQTQTESTKPEARNTSLNQQADCNLKHKRSSKQEVQKATHQQQNQPELQSKQTPNLV